MITDVIFDLGRVLVDWDPRHLYRRRFADERDMERFLAEVCSSEWHLELDRGRPWDEAVEMLVRRHPAHAAHIRAYRDDWPEMFAGEMPGTAALLGRLAAAGYRLHALSNYPAEPVEFLYETYGWMRHFDVVGISGRLGLVKPDAAIYRWLLDAVARPPAACLFIDDRSENVRAARDAGMDAVHFETADRLEDELARRGLRLPG